ncbi:hypothetical protein Tco_1130612, partial [Tanacetum coccineum]
YDIAYSSIGTADRDYSFAGSRPHQTGRDVIITGSRPHQTGTACRDTKTSEFTANIGDNTTGITGTHWRSSTARYTRGGW